MKKLIGVIAVLLLFSACAGEGEDKHEITYIGLSDTDKELFQSEVAVNEALYLNGLESNYTVSKLLPITATNVDAVSNVFEMDLAVCQNIYSSIIPNASLQLDESQINDGELFNTKIKGLVYDCGGNIGVSALWFYLDADQRAWMRMPFSLEGVQSHFEMQENSELYTGLSTQDMYHAHFVKSLQNGADTQILIAFTHQLTSGTKVRVSFLAEKKQSN